MSTAGIDVDEQLDNIKQTLLIEDVVVKVVDVSPTDGAEAVEVNGNHHDVEIASEVTSNELPERRKPEESVKIIDPIESEVFVNDDVINTDNPEQTSETVDDGETERIVEESDDVQVEHPVDGVKIEDPLGNSKETVHVVTPDDSKSVLIVTPNEAPEENVVIGTPSQGVNEDVVEHGEKCEENAISDAPESVLIDTSNEADEENVIIETPSQSVEKVIVENGGDIRIDSSLDRSESIPRELVEDKVLVVEPSKYGNFKPKIKIAMPKLKLLNGETMPVFGLGTWESSPEDVNRAVRAAIDFGYRHIDTAYVYKNEKAVGEALAAKIAEGVVKREELFVCTKLWNIDHEPQDVEKACRRSLELLGLDYLDLYLMHTPMGFKSGTQLVPKIAGVVQYSSVDYLDTWYEMEKLVSAGLTKSIGVSNFNISQLERLWSKAKIKPVTNQVECHPFLNQQKISSWCAINGVVLTAYSSLGRGSPSENADNSEVLIENKVVKDLAQKYGRSPAQILLRYQVDRGHATIPKSVTPSRIQENIGALEFQLKPEDVYALNQLNKNKRYVPFIGFGETHKYYPFNSPN